MTIAVWAYSLCLIRALIIILGRVRVDIYLGPLGLFRTLAVVVVVCTRSSLFVIMISRIN